MIRKEDMRIERDFETELGIVTIVSEIEELGGNQEYECQECGCVGDYDFYVENNGRCDTCGLILQKVGYGEDEYWDGYDDFEIVD